MSAHFSGRFSKSIEEMLREAGWLPGRDVSRGLKLPEGFTLFPAAQRVLSEFGNLRIGKSGPGLVFARTPVVLDPALAFGEEGRFHEFAVLLKTNLYPLGETADGHSFVVIDEKGRVFLIFEEISFVDETFELALDNLLQGARQIRMVDENGNW